MRGFLFQFLNFPHNWPLEFVAIRLTITFGIHEIKRLKEGHNIKRNVGGGSENLCPGMKQDNWSEMC